MTVKLTHQLFLGDNYNLAASFEEIEISFIYNAKQFIPKECNTPINLYRDRIVNLQLQLQLISCRRPDNNENALSLADRTQKFVNKPNQKSDHIHFFLL